jgi:valyl-tRNA synthetase
MEQGGAMADFTLPKRYDFRDVERRLYEWWEGKGYFTPQVDPARRPFTISMPPPNVTGKLHLGHAMFVSMEDLMIRHSRMRGRPTLWLPGTDHAGIATQLQVERALQGEGLRREDIGREAFVERTWEWKRTYGGAITQQLRRLGASCDWSRERFTLDRGLSRSVREAFVRLYEKGLIYRDTYLINWSPGLRTAVSDLEVEYHQEEGTLYYFNYPLAASDQAIPVATTRPETILGDTAVAVHPEDERFWRFVGRTCLVPILNRPIPVIADDYVDREFGTGALKITPGHDPNDYEIGKRHHLEIINVLNTDATMNENAGPYAGMDRFECREKLWADMRAEGLTIKTEPYLMQVPRSQRGGEIVEPMVSTQWFVRMKPLAEPALYVVRGGEVSIVPDHFTKVYYNWLDNIRDWCISRQLWWGHRIPAWHCSDCGQITVAREEPERCASCGSTAIEQDPDVLDTWFSSALWPFSTLGWPEETEDLGYFYPTSLMETGYDILFFWVARMIMMGLELTGQAPFNTIYLHGLVRVEGGQKMSKTFGNIIDPLEIIDQFGADALRFTLLTGSTPGTDMTLDANRLEANRNFANKLWNIGRLVLMSLDRAPIDAGGQVEPSAADRWILARLNELQRSVNRLLGGHQYAEAGRQIQDFVWGEYADWYLEIAKLQLRSGDDRAWSTARTLTRIFDTCLRLLHPYMPFVTEELWGKLKAACQAKSEQLSPEDGWEEALIVARWPESPDERAGESREVSAFSAFMDVVRAIRNARSEHQVEAGLGIGAFIRAGEQEDFLQAQSPLLAALAHIDPGRLHFIEPRADGPRGAIALVVGPIEILLPLEEMIDVQAELERLMHELREAERQVSRLEELLAGPFSRRAPRAVVQKERDRLEEVRATREKLRARIEDLKG